MAKKKTGCTSCKQKPANNITQLTVEMDEDLQLAYDYIQIASQLKGERLDHVERVWKQLTGSKLPLNRSCRQCLVAACNVIRANYNAAKK